MTVDGSELAPPDHDGSTIEFAPIGNTSELLGHGLLELRRVALDIAATGLAAADPGAAVHRLVTVEGSTLRVGDRVVDLDTVRSVVVLGGGKATMPIAAALEAVLGDRLSRGLIVRRSGDPGTLDRLDVIAADHPVPSDASLAAGRRLLECADRCGPDDLVITAFTGGSSALACAPPPGVPFAAKQALHSLLLHSGASIGEINAVRKHVSAIKGGRLAARLGGATIINLTVSDAVGDALDLLCDLVVPDSTAVSDALAVLRRYDLWDAVAPEIREHLLSGSAESPTLTGLDITSCVLVNGSVVASAMADRARELGRTPVVLGSSLEGEAATLGGVVGSLAAESSLSGQPFAPGAVLIGAGGEATVSIGRAAGTVTGWGGPNQEVALGFARAVARSHVSVAGVFLDSDGSDGGSAAAGACVDSTTVARAERLDVDLRDAVVRHDSGEALTALGDLVVTGPTGTNISDLIVVAVGGAAVEPDATGHVMAS